MKASGAAFLLFIGSVLPTVQNGACATTCAPSTEAAVLQALRGAAPTEGTVEGFRVRDVVIDPLLHRAFVHVEQCGHPERPLVLLPFAKSTGSADPRMDGSEALTILHDQGSGPTVASGSKVAVTMGGVHMRLTVQGRLLQSATVGSEVDVQLASLQEGEAMPGEERKRVHGRLTAADRVEVQP